jgi:hypothetical protein
MDEFTYGASSEKKGIPGRARCRFGVVWTMLLVVIIIVLPDFSDFWGKRGQDPTERQELQEKATDKEKGTFSQKERSDQGRDIVVTEKDLQKAYKDLLNQKMKEVETATFLENYGLYLIELINGKALTAVTVQLDRKMAIITDQQGMIISIGREEIAGIKKIETKANGRKKK